MITYEHNSPKRWWDSAKEERSSGCTRLYHDWPSISSFEYPRKYKTLEKRKKHKYSHQVQNEVLNICSCGHAAEPVWHLSAAHVQPVDTGEAVARVGVVALQAVDCWGAESNEQWLVGDTGRGGEGGRLVQRLEAAFDQHGAAASVLQLEGLGGLHTTHKTPLCWGATGRSTCRRTSAFLSLQIFVFRVYILVHKN